MDLVGCSTLFFDEQRRYQQLTQTVANGVLSVRSPEAVCAFLPRVQPRQWLGEHSRLITRSRHRNNAIPFKAKSGKIRSAV